MRPILLLEINEVPLRVWKKFADDSRFPSIGRFLEECKLVETEVSDEGELSPWCTWPSFHRGLSKLDHGIFNLGQDPSTFRGTPIWEEFRRRGYSVGIFGSMQSWPPVDPGLGGFYLPDTFSADSRCVPHYLEPIQAFNLLQVRSNARVMADRALRNPPKLKLLLSMLQAGVRLSTLIGVAGQLLAERFDFTKRERRVAFQALLFWDIFRAHFDSARPPAFTTFFTNHVASVMHRYWNHIFPEDFPPESRPSSREHVGTMDFSMTVIDRILFEALAWRSKNPHLLVLVANSMGQRAVLREKHEGFELLVRRPLDLLALVQPGAKARQNLAMAPQVSLELDSQGEALDAAGSINSIRLPSGFAFLTADARGESLSIGCHTPPESELREGVVIFGGERIPLARAGLEKVRVDPGTAYHEKEGILLAHGLAPEENTPTKIDISSAKDLILRWADLDCGST